VYIRPGEKHQARVTVLFQSKDHDEVVDTSLPEVITESLVSECDDDVPCNQQTWNALWRVKDEQSGLFLIKMKDTNDNIPFWWRDNFAVGSTQWVSVKAHVSCCADGVGVEVVDIKNNNLIGYEERANADGPLDLAIIIGVSVGVGVTIILVVVGVCVYKKKYSPVPQSG